MPKTKKNLAAVVALSAVVVAGGATAAFAYWTAGGTGTGSAVSSTTAAIIANQTTVLTELNPGEAAQVISGTFTNGNDSPVYVTSVTASISSVTPVGTGTCDTSDYTLADAVMAVGDEIEPGNAVGAWTGATIAFNNKADTNQDGCKGATVALAYTIL